MKITDIQDIKELAQLMIDSSTVGTDRYNAQLFDCISRIDQKLSEIRIIHMQIKNIQRILGQYPSNEAAQVGMEK